MSAASSTFEAHGVHVRSFGQGRPVIALHPLALDGAALEDVGRALAARGYRALAVDLPGFGRSPAPRAPLTPARLAAPVVSLARDLDEPPAVIGISMGGRVALEAALAASEAFRSVIAIAPYLPWLRFRWALGLARLLDPAAAARLPLERLWPLLRRLADGIEGIGLLGDDAVARAGARVVYQASCPAMRESIVSAAREMALDPAYGADGLWDRLYRLRLPAAFVWAERDRLVPVAFAPRVEAELPDATQLVLPCLVHALNGPHHRCLVEAVVDLLREDATAPPSGRCCVDALGNSSPAASSAAAREPAATR